MKNTISEKVRLYQILNEITMKNEIVIFGSDFTADFPFYELSLKHVMSNAIYNRSIRSLTLKEADEALKACVIDVRPEKVFLSLGENDPGDSSSLNLYKTIIQKIKRSLPQTEIYVLSVYGSESTSFNDALKDLCLEMKVDFIKLPSETKDDPGYYEKAFKTLSLFFRRNRISFADAIAISN